MENRQLSVPNVEWLMAHCYSSPVPPSAFSPTYRGMGEESRVLPLSMPHTPQTSIHASSLLPSPDDETAFAQTVNAPAFAERFQVSSLPQDSLSQFHRPSGTTQVIGNPFRDLTLEAIVRDNRRSYSSDINKVYVNRKTKLPIEFRVNRDVPPGTWLRIKAVFDEKRFPADILERCCQHQLNMEDDLPPAHCQPESTREHFILSLNEHALYTKNANNNELSLAVPFNVGSGQSVNEQLMFTCQCICPSIRSRPYHLEFNLECSDHQSAVTKLGIKVCSSIKRDRQADEEKLRTTVKSETSMATPGATKRRKQSVQQSSSTAGHIAIPVKGIIFVSDPKLVEKTKKRFDLSLKRLQEDVDLDEAELDRHTTASPAAVESEPNSQ